VAQRRKRKGSLQTRLKSKSIPHGDSACGKVWCNESSLENKTRKTADLELTELHQVKRRKDGVQSRDRKKR
jgi:hypothetical protein